MVKKELPLGSCSFFLDPAERSAPRAKKKAREVALIPSESLLAQYQSHNADIKDPLQDVAVAAARIFANEGHEEIKQERIKTLNDIKSRVGSLRSKIR